MHTRCTPCAANAGMVGKNCEVDIGIDLKVGFRSCETRPTCVDDDDSLWHCDAAVGREQRNKRRRQALTEAEWMRNQGEFSDLLGNSYRISACSSESTVNRRERIMHQARTSIDNLVDTSAQQLRTNNARRRFALRRQTISDA